MTDPTLVLARGAVVVALAASSLAVSTCAWAERVGRLYFLLLGLTGVLAVAAGMGALTGDGAVICHWSSSLPVCHAADIN